MMVTELVRDATTVWLPALLRPLTGKFAVVWPAVRAVVDTTLPLSVMVRVAPGGTFVRLTVPVAV